MTNENLEPTVPTAPSQLDATIEVWARRNMHRMIFAQMPPGGRTRPFFEHQDPSGYLCVLREDIGTGQDWLKLHDYLDISPSFLWNMRFADDPEPIIIEKFDPSDRRFSMIAQELDRTLTYMEAVPFYVAPMYYMSGDEMAH